ncbi:DnaB-like helicase N-terminal domain-containing protein [Actinomadura sp. HBU206391]|uniref:DnaB-like helicase N-terminal domain-containing protein n=1 Tax=Actinomadura sp. HBU206391 TaxID=2731692 RepID=UPI00164F3E44|nr:DnaB-like helicase N-terminal domain-containing protein [Actinomadura sp. HBU206391]MBC6458397.1 AAA family ATPase [Actinomadura sp. HBU206391]
MSDEFERIHPADIPAEQSVLGAMLLSPDAIGAAAEQVQPDDFFRPTHQEIYKAILDLYGRGMPADPIAVRALLEKNGQLHLVEGGAYLHTLMTTVPTVANIATYIAEVVECSTLRRLIRAGTQVVEMGYRGRGDVDGVIAESEAAIRRVSKIADSRISDFSTAGAFVDQPDDRNETIIPGVLEVQERVIVVASEGAGKSTLARHVWVCVAAGLNPFSFVEIPPKRTLLVDLENPPGLVRRKARGLVTLGRQVPGWDDDRCWRWTRPGGLDLKRPRDQHLLDRAIADARPDLMLMGPLYKSFVDGGERAEQLNSQVAAFLDQMREKHGIALWLETHAPLDQAGQRSLRPMGSGVWSRWPEFGLALKKSKDEKDPPHTLIIERFRGDRDERAWPDKLRRGRPWPFEGVFGEDAYTDPRSYNDTQRQHSPACTECGNRIAPLFAADGSTVCTTCKAKSGRCESCGFDVDSVGHESNCGTP